MKLAGITWWRNNYGSILQAYALQMALESIDDINYEIICQYGKKIASVDNLVEKFMTMGIKDTMWRAFWKFGMRGVRTRSNALQKFIDENLNISDKQFNDKTITEANTLYDSFVCGSDQIWNPSLTELDSMYWLNFVKSGKPKFSYAPSIGIKEATIEQSRKIKENLSDFCAVSCREVSGARLINEILDGEICFTVLDPTLMVDKCKWDQVCTPRRVKEKYVFAYLLRGSKKERKLVEKFAFEKNLKVVTLPFLEVNHIVPYDFKFGDIKDWNVSPIDFISLIRNAEYTFTDSFHCMIFSCLYHTPYFNFSKNGTSQMSRIHDLQKTLELPNRLIRQNDSVESITSRPSVDWEKMESILAEKRQESQYFLNFAVEKCIEKANT